MVAFLVWASLAQATAWREETSLLKFVLSRAPGHAGYWIERAATSARDGNVNAARNEYQQALQLLRDAGEGAASEGHKRMVLMESWNTLTQLAQLEYEQGQDQRRALEALRAAIQIRPEEYSSRLLAGILCGQVGNLEESIEHLEMAVQVRPDSAEPHYNLANALNLAGRTGEARAQMARAAELAPGNATIQDALERMQ
jgi:tetratricopeptide (TPR) repeat protein